MIRINLVRGKRKKRRELNIGSAWLALPLVVLAGTIYFHATVSGRITKLDVDIEKANAAVLAGWRVLHFLPEHVTDGSALSTIERALLPVALFREMRGGTG